jgi:hypothetical protein
MKRGNTLKNKLLALLAIVLLPSVSEAVNNIHSQTLKSAPISADETFIYDSVASATKKMTLAPFLVGSCTGFPCLDGTSDGGDLIKLYGAGGYWTALQAGSAVANRSWRLPIDAAPAAGTTRLINMNEYGQMGFVDPATVGGASTLDALTDVDTTGAANGSIIKYNGSSWVVGTDNSGAGATVSDTAYDATSWNAITDVAPSKNAVRDWIESLPSLVISTGLTDNSGTVSVTNPVTAEAFSGSGWNADTEGLTRNDAYDYLHIGDTDDDGLVNKVDIAAAGLLKTDSSGVLSTATAGADYEASTPSTKILTTSAAVSAADFLAAKYMSNYGAAGTVAFTLPAVSYNISRAIISEEPNGGSGRAVSVCPPSGEAFSTPIGTQTADECISATAAVGSTIIATRYKTGASTWAYRLDPVVGTWTEVGTANISAYLTTAALDGTPDSGSTTTAPNAAWAYTHENGTAVHGATGAVVGTTNTQTLTNKSITAVEVVKTASGSLSAAEVSGTIVSNYGMTDADMTLTLPTAAAGYNALFTVGSARSRLFGVKPATGEYMTEGKADGTVTRGSASGGLKMTSAVIGQTFACWTFRTTGPTYEWMCKAGQTAGSTFVAY